MNYPNREVEMAIELADEVDNAIESGELVWEASRCKNKAGSAICYEADWGKYALQLLRNGKLKVLDDDGELQHTVNSKSLKELWEHLKKTHAKKGLSDLISQGERRDDKHKTKSS